MPSQKTPAELEKTMTQEVLLLQDVHYQVSAESESLSIIKGCDLSVQQGDSLAIVGRSGSGKSTLLALMAGLELPTSGDVALFGESLSQLSDDRRARLRARQVGFVFQNFQLMPSMTALENVLMPLELFQMPDAKERALQALEKVGLSHRLDHVPARLSGGEQQRVALARAFVTEPKILFADEPTGNLDETTAEQIQQLLFEFNRSLGTTLILVTHDVDFAARCHRQVHLLHGRFVEDAV